MEQQEGQEFTNPDAWAENSGAKTLDLETMEALSKDYLKTWDEYEQFKKAASEKYEVFQGVEQKILAALRDAQKSKYSAEVGAFAVSVKSTVKVPSTIEAKKQFFAYLKKMGDDLMLSMQTVNSNSLNSWYVKTKEAAGDPPGFAIPGITESSSHTTLRFTGAKPKGA